jgi:hypothetical protein
MPIIISYQEGKGYQITDPDSGAKVGRWCAKETGQVPDRCEHCWDPETLAHYPAEGYYEETDEASGRVWLYGLCHRCLDHVKVEHNQGVIKCRL